MLFFESLNLGELGEVPIVSIIVFSALWILLGKGHLFPLVFFLEGWMALQMQIIVIAFLLGCESGS